MSKQETPVIVLPTESARLAQLRAKLEEYRSRIDPYKHPALQIDTWMKIAVLEKLFTGGMVRTWDLSREFEEKYGDSFSLNDFNNACAVIDDYCKTGGTNTSGGTGLPGAKN